MIGILLAFAKTFGSCFIQAFNDDDTYVFEYQLIERALRTEKTTGRGSRLILGIAPARINDNIAMVWRRGQNVEKIVCFKPPCGDDRKTADEFIWEWIAREIRNFFPDDIYVDVGGIGGNVCRTSCGHSVSTPTYMRYISTIDRFNAYNAYPSHNGYYV